MRARLLLPALILAFAVVSIAQPAEAATTGTVQGTVRDLAGKPLAGISVTLIKAGLKTVTGKTGDYVFTGVPPGDDTVSAAAATYAPAAAEVTVTQDVAVVADIVLQPNTVNTGRSRIIGSLSNRTVPEQQYLLTPRLEQIESPDPNNLDQFPGLVFGQPGITYDPTGGVHIRGTDINQVGYQIDGIPITEPMTNSFATDLVTVGMRAANLYTGGPDASYGGYTGGYLNQTTLNGRDLAGRDTLQLTAGPFNNWNFGGVHADIGNSISNKVDYYIGDIAFHNAFPGNTSTQALNSSIDNVVKVNYYADSNDTLTFFNQHGFEQYDFYEPPPTTTDTLKWEDGVQSLVDTGNYQQDHLDQGYDLTYSSYRHNFSSTSFLTYRLSRLYSTGVVHVENTGLSYQDRHADQIDNALDYTNDLSANDELRAGFMIMPATTFDRAIFDYGLAQSQINNDFGLPGLRDHTSEVNPTTTSLYLIDQLKALHDRASLEFGLRYGNMNFDVKNLPSYSDHYLDPNIGATYSPTRDLVFRGSFAVESEFPDTSLIEQASPEFLGLVPTVSPGVPPSAQQAYISRYYGLYNPLGAMHANDMNVDAEEGFRGHGSLSGNYSASLTVYRHDQYDLQQYNRTFFVDPNTGSYSGPRTYNNAGKGRADGFEMKLTRPARNLYDLNGFVSYTNQVAKATNSGFDSGASFEPYFAMALAGEGGALGLTDSQFRSFNAQQFPTTYDERHTIAAVANKRLTKLIEESVVVDAGSGFPFVGGTLAGAGLLDGQHGLSTIGGASFSEVPITVFDGHTLQPLNPTTGTSGWHFKLSLNTSFHVSSNTSLFVNVDNVLNSSTVLNYSTTSLSGKPYYLPASAQYPEGRIYYGAQYTLPPLFVGIGVKHMF